MAVGNISSKEYRRLIWRSLHLQSVACFERQQGIAYGYALLPTLKRIWVDDEEGYKEALNRGISFFNITPACVTYVMGMNIAVEEEAKKNPDFDRSTINALKTSLMGPLSGIGDAIFWGALRTITLGIGVSFAAVGSLIGPFIFLALYNIPHFWLRWNGLKIGYKQGINFVTNASESGTLTSLTTAAKIVGATVVGSMIYSIVNFNTTIVIKVNEVMLDLQANLFDTILPGLLPLVLCFTSFHFIRKGKKATTVMLWMFAIALILGFLEGLPMFQMPAES